MKRLNGWKLMLAVIALLVGALIAGGLWVRGVAAAAADGKSQAIAGARSLAALNATAAASQFGTATERFAYATRSLGPDWAAGAIERIPWAGRQYAAVRSLAHIGLDGSTAGLELAQALQESSPASASPSPDGQLGTLLSAGRPHLEAALASLSDAAERADKLSPDGLVPQLANAVRSVRAVLHDGAPFLNRSRALLQLESYLLSGSHRILVVSQDGAELRPTGGWAGSFGIINVGASGLKLESYRDVFALRDPPHRVAPPRGALQTDHLNFRNANWWLDFPTSAKAMLGFWGLAGRKPVDALIVVDTVAMQDLLAVLGPITLPRYGTTFTSENLLDRLLYLVQVQQGGQPGRKNVLVELATELETRVQRASPDRLARSALALGRAADAKHIQVYFTDPKAQAAADSLGWSGRVAPPNGTTDVVAISNAMNAPSKVNVAMKKTIRYNVRLQRDRSAETTLVLEYANTLPYPPLPSLFRDWLRVYRAPGTIFKNTTPDGGKTITLTEFGFPAEARNFSLKRGQSGAETLVARVPKAMGDVGTPAGGPSGSVLYRLYLVRQADLEDIPTAVTVAAPPGWHVTGSSAHLIASGTSVPVTWGRDAAQLTSPLSGDLALDVTLAP